MALAKKDNMVEYRWKIKYPDARKNEAGPWVVGKRAAMKDFFQTLCGESELASTLTKDLKETVYLDKRVLNHSRNKFVDCCIGSDNPFKHDKYKLFTWKVIRNWGYPKQDTGIWTNAKRDGWTDIFAKCTNELLHCSYDVCGNMGCKEYLYMRRPLPCFERMLPLVGTVERWFEDCHENDHEK